MSRHLWFACATLLGMLWLTGQAAADDQRSPLPKAVDSPIKLFNGRDLSNFYTWLADTKHEDPRGVFTVEDEMIRISGDGFGGLLTKEAYRDYHLIVEFRWGERTWEPRATKSRDSGIMLHCAGPDGNASGGAWMASIECQIIEGGVGDFIVVGGKYEDGVLVNEGFAAFPSGGKIMLQTEGAEIYFRKVELWPLTAETPAFPLPQIRQ